MTKPNPHEPFLNGHLLIAMPGMDDPRFARSVVFICEHSNEGAMGLVINKPARGIKFADLVDQLNLPDTDDAPNLTVMVGGPMDHSRGFVLHSADYSSAKSTLHVSTDFAMTAQISILKRVAAGKGPSNCLLTLGNASWGPAQLEGELRQNLWISVKATPELVFQTTPELIWGAALTSLGVDPRLLTAHSGHV